MRESVLTATVAAISTPPGKGGVALIRISGDEAFQISDKVFIPRSGKKFSDCKPRSAVFGDILAEGKTVDDGIAIRFPAPHSFTGEDTVEITCHGGILITRTVLEAVFAAGATPAPAGEFTRRSFLNGHLSLSDAEAVGNLLEAKSKEQIFLAGSASRDRLSQSIRSIREELLSLMTSLFARIDYPDEDLGEFGDAECSAILEGVLGKLDSLTATYRTGRAVNEGIRTVICGKPNAGKSTLYNALAGDDAAIVTDVPGTTRDVLERTLPLGRVLLHVSDTAGVRKTDDPVEKIGVAKSEERIRSAELILAVFDVSRPLDHEDHALISLLKEANGCKIALLNKSDLPARFSAANLAANPGADFDADFDAVLSLSAANGDCRGLSDLVNRLFTDEKIVTGQDAIVFSARQNASLQGAAVCVRSALDAFRLGIGADAASSDVERALALLGEVEGISVNDEIVAGIFSKFCVGK